MPQDNAARSDPFAAAFDEILQRFQLFAMTAEQAERALGRIIISLHPDGGLEASTQNRLSFYIANCLAACRKDGSLRAVITGRLAAIADAAYQGDGQLGQLMAGHPAQDADVVALGGA